MNQKIIISALIVVSVSSLALNAVLIWERSAVIRDQSDRSRKQLEEQQQAVSELREWFEQHGHERPELHRQWQKIEFELHKRRGDEVRENPPSELPEA